ncbi:hypothetical protein I302_107560 [Kwoniella bestiolae CBS 10118]|uniref:Mid2 domain-containing protein n=1 Tax=Kwoniella bestiolae CBS 10118 TaxID=1296100 RepID=A0A1B9FY67_9TREE|nr:hypothetical protein I302_06699 [Kwoniella bestiolae CBS 10118]OCF23716.1 hypothetical protein I302_06699 [Kwoniella bestiolae CBS 10118]
MKISTTLPILLLPFALAHAHGIAPAHGHLGRRNNSLRSVRAKELEGRQHSGGLLGGLVDDDSTSGTSTHSSTTARTTISPTTTSSSSTLISTEKNEDEETTTNAISRITTSATGLTTPSPTGSSLVSASLGASISASSSIVSSANLTSSANTTSTETATSTAPTSSSSESSAASVQYTTDAAGQTQLVTVILTAAAATAAESTASSTSSAKPKDGGDSIPTAAIIGISVGVGVVVIALIAFAVWRMKRRNGDEDEAIRWPELNRHGDSDAHHALPARQTGQHGFETNPLSRSLSNSSSIFAPSSTAQLTSGAPPMALNGSSFGASSSLEDEYMNEKQSVHSHGHSHEARSHDDHDNYTSMPPPVLPQMYDHGHGHGHAGQMDDGEEDPYGGMSMANDQHVTMPNPHDMPYQGQGRPGFRLE